MLTDGRRTTDDRRRTKSDGNSSHGLKVRWAKKKGCTRIAAASDKAYRLLAHDRWFSPGTPASSTTKTGCHDIAEIVLKVGLNTKNQLVLLWAQLIKIYTSLPTSVQPISITKTLVIVPTKNERDPPLFTGMLLKKFQNILRNTTQVIIRHRVKILFSVISSPITLERQKVKIVKNERDPALFTGKLLIKF